MIPFSPRSVSGQQVTDDQLRELAAKACACGEPDFVALLGPCIGCVAAAAVEERARYVALASACTMYEDAVAERVRSARLGMPSTTSAADRLAAMRRLDQVLVDARELLEERDS